MSEKSFYEEIADSSGAIGVEIAGGRIVAHEKHGENSIEAIDAGNVGRWLPILGEEFGEVCEALTYDKDSGNLRDELVDVATVAIAWIAAIDRWAAES